MTISKTLLAAIASLAVASAAPALAQDPHQHDAPGQPAQTAAPSSCPMNGSGMGSMQQGMMGGVQMQQMMQTMQQMHAEMAQMHKEMMQMHQDMQHGRGK